MTSIERYREWKEKVTDPALKKELEKMEGDSVAIENAFYKDLEFGTGGMRGILGVGTNCLNIYNIRNVTEGVSRAMEAKGKKSAVISYDSRINSKLFAKTTASVFASHGFKVFLVPEESPTPFLSYAVRKLACDMGVMITASHNPKQYNGYKLFDATGCQVLDDEANEIISYVDKVDPFEVKPRTFEYYLKNGAITYVEQWVYGAFLNDVETQALNDVKPLKIVYTPLNGAGFKLVPEVLYERGFKDITIVEKQAMPNGRFTTCPFPNPEKPEALKLAIELAEKNGADLVLATDPDCDRVGIAVKHEGKYVLLTGNEVGALLTDYVLGTRYARWNLPANAVVVRTIVTSSLVDKICENFGVSVTCVLTGFKWIGNVIEKLKAEGDANRFVLGFEESYGYLIGTHCRDKDAVVASMLIAEMTSNYASEGKTLIDQLNLLYQRYGKYEHKNISKKFEGASGNAKMKALMDSLRTSPISVLGGGNVINSIDFMDQSVYDVPKSNVMLYETDNGLTVVVRPSGTEPLIKFYITASKSEQENEALFEAAISDINKIFA
ncbi:MAG: phospho-sugar mutase [Clostridia bacterium]|nr:phospho-sugar mutase [Clostridia bacterium]